MRLGSQCLIALVCVWHGHCAAHSPCPAYTQSLAERHGENPEQYKVTSSWLAAIFFMFPFISLIASRVSFWVCAKPWTLLLLMYAGSSQHTRLGGETYTFCLFSLMSFLISVVTTGIIARIKLVINMRS